MCRCSKSALPPQCQSTSCGAWAAAVEHHDRAKTTGRTGVWSSDSDIGSVKRCFAAGERFLCGAAGWGAVGDAKSAAVAGTTDHAVTDLVDGAALMGAGRREGLELTGVGLGEHRRLLGEQFPAAGRYLGGGHGEWHGVGGAARTATCGRGRGRGAAEECPPGQRRRGWFGRRVVVGHAVTNTMVTLTELARPQSHLDALLGHARTTQPVEEAGLLNPRQRPSQT